MVGSQIEGRAPEPFLDEPPRDCPLCPRLVAYREEWRRREPDWWNAPVPTFGPDSARGLVVGLAPGLRGANRTGRPFTGDDAGNLLYPTFLAHRLARGDYRRSPDDGLALTGISVTNAVRCVPPANKPTGAEIATCRRFLAATIERMAPVAVLALGRIAHESTVKALGGRLAATPFAHGAEHGIADVALFDSYHPSRYNTNTGLLTAPMFDAVVGAFATRLRKANA